MIYSGGSSNPVPVHASSAETGSTLVEVLVSIALLSGVLIPMLLMIGLFSSDHQNRLIVNAMHIAQENMEILLSSDDYDVGRTQNEYQSYWIIGHDIAIQGRLVILHVNVFHRSREDAVVQFMTYRLIKSENE